MQYTTVQCSTLHYNAVHYSTMQYTTLQCSTLQYNASTLHYNAVHYSFLPPVPQEWLWPSNTDCVFPTLLQVGLNSSHGVIFSMFFFIFLFWYGLVHFCTVQFNVHYSTVHGTLQYSTMYITTQYNVHYNTVQYTLQYNTANMCHVSFFKQLKMSKTHGINTKSVCWCLGTFF